MKSRDGQNGVAVIMLLLSLPLLLFLLAAAIETAKLVQKKKKMREECFAAAMQGLRSEDISEATAKLAATLPETDVIVAESPDTESGGESGAQQRLVYSLKNKETEFNCGATATWENQAWKLEIVLDKF